MPQFSPRAGLALCAALPLALLLSACRPVQAPAAAGPTPAPVQLGSDHPDTVQLDTGAVRGARDGDVLAFKGIPYAAPPVGDLRWRPPQPVNPWTDTRAATAFAPDCIQAPNDTEKIQTTPSEDCLYLNVWRPTGIAAGTALPVLVWVHGGGFAGGGTSIPWYDGSSFARQGIVVVSLNYRLGRLGFFAHPALLAEQPDGLVGNYGFMDQIAALQWVQANIGAFGGDPARVTLAGESAGGISVLALMTSPVARPLFHQAVVMSGGGRDALITRQLTGGSAQQPSADQIDQAFAEAQGVAATGAAALAALRALPAATVQGDFNLGALAQEALLGKQIFPGVPVFDGKIVTGQPGDLLASNKGQALPLLIGTTALDLPLFFPPARLNPLAWFGPDAEQAQVAYDVPTTLDRNSLAALLLAMGADMTMHEPARFAARQITAHGFPAWLYRFTYTAQGERPDSMQQGHAGELPFFFDQLAARYGSSSVVTEDTTTARAFNTYVANFVKTGNPNGQDLPPWRPFDPAVYDLMHFGPDGPVYTADPRAERIELVERAREREQ